MEIIHLPSVESTNAHARALAESGAAHGTLVVADRQTKGRGRLGRVWEDGGVGNCMASVILRPRLPTNKAPLLCLAAAVAIQSQCGESVGVKWPNDLLTKDGRKVGGILAEMEIKHGLLDFIVVGFGVNLVSPPKGVPLAASLREFGVEVPASVFAKKCARGLLTWGKRLETESESLIAAWNTVDVTVGRLVTVGEVRGRATGIRADGALLVAGTDDVCHVVRAGDVEMVAEL